jgi:hypothetical protein
MRGIGYAAEMDAGRRFIEDIEPDDVVVLLFGGDAESCCSAAILTRTLGQMGDELVYPVYLEKGETLYSSEIGKRVAAKNPSRMIAIGMCDFTDPIVADLRTMVMDDHRPNGSPPVELFVTTYAADPPAPLCLLVYEMCKGLLFYDGCEWLAAVGIAAHSGVRSDFEILRNACSVYGEHIIKNAVDLLSAGCKSSMHDLEMVYNVLMEADGPPDISNLTVPGGERLNGYRAEVESEFRKVMQGELISLGEWALIEYSSHAMVEDLVADAISEDAPDKAALAANHGYIDGKVSFSIAKTLSPMRSTIRSVLNRHSFRETSSGRIYGIVPKTEFALLMEQLHIGKSEKVLPPKKANKSA